MNEKNNFAMKYEEPGRRLVYAVGCSVAGLSASRKLNQALTWRASL